MTLAIIGGSGLYEMEGLEDREGHTLETPYGAPSGEIVRGRLGEVELLFLARHGEGHHLAPHEINYRANICALKMLGATQLLSASAVGSMREEIAPGHVVIVDQFIDLSKSRPSTFFEGGVVAHVSFGEPTCPNLSQATAAAAERAGATVHLGGTYVCMEGPQFSTKAESLLYRSWGVSVVGMTAMPEAKLAREAELPYALLAMATDYDCWHENEEAVNVSAVIAVLKQNAGTAKETIRHLAPTLPDPQSSDASQALSYAVITDPAHRGKLASERLRWLLG